MKTLDVFVGIRIRKDQQKTIMFGRRAKLRRNYFKMTILWSL